MKLPTDIATRPGRMTICGAPEGADALALLQVIARAEGPVIHIARDAPRMMAMEEALAFFGPDVERIILPAWDCLPFDRVSPRADIASQRIGALAELGRSDGHRRIVLTTVNAAAQRLPPGDMLAGESLWAGPGHDLDPDVLIRFLERNGYGRVGTVREPGEYAVRGGLIDLWPAGENSPVRLDFFGDTVETIRVFDAESQTTTGKLEVLDLSPAGEVQLTDETIHRFRSGYVAEFGPVIGDDPLYEAVSSGQRHAGIEHWLPLFFERLDTLFDYLPKVPVVLDCLAEEALSERQKDIADYYDARVLAMNQPMVAGAAPYKPLPAVRLYLDGDEWAARMAERPVRLLSPNAEPETEAVVDAGGRPGRNFAPERRQTDIQVFRVLATHMTARMKDKRRVVIASYSEGARDRLMSLLSDQDFTAIRGIDNWQAARAWPKNQASAVVLGLEHGFETADLTVISEQDVLGDRLIRAGRRKRRAENFLSEASALSAGDLVVHIDHGVGRYKGLEAIDVAGAPHDCLRLEYHGGDRLYLPVENIELLSRYGSEEATAQLDRLGGGAWQAKKAKLKERIREIADKLIKIAAERALREGEIITPPTGLYDEFVARFPFEETEDQDRSIAQVLEDLSSGKPMDRLVCGDVGFGKTEIALRVAFVTALAGKQVAIVVPTTLLARQHYKNFTERFAGWPVRIGQLSRLVGHKEANQTREGLTSGDVDIVIGTHALLARNIKFKDLALLVIDEEQHFGVAHKERLKELKADVHVLTLSATPIPRTLQLAMSGVRELSLIATPPVDRLAVRTYVTPFDPVVIREALLREKFRGGQAFFVVPRIKDLTDVESYLKEHVPEVRYAIAHGQMAPGALDEIMNAFYDGKHDVLLCTTIVESGLDVPTANTLVVHRADMFGLAQLYQIRGRIGRSKTRAYAYLTTNPRKVLTPNAERRLRVLQSLDTLGAGFTLASHDLDIRGAGNLLGEEQSGHIREVGFELYQEMLEEAVAQLRSGDLEIEVDGQWSPQINLGAAVLIPESYVADLDLRLSLYRRLSELEEEEQLEGFAAEMIDRFGSLPSEVDHLIEIVRIKIWCRRAGLAKIDSGPKGVVLTFHDDLFANPAGLVGFIARQRGLAKLRPDHRLVLQREWESVSMRLKGSLDLAKTLARIAEEGKAAA